MTTDPHRSRSFAGADHKAARGGRGSASLSSFWQTWFYVWCASVAAFGIVLSFGALEATDGPVRVLLSVLGQAPVAMDGAVRFTLAVMGPVTIAWAITIATAGWASGRLPRTAARTVWLGITLAVATWFVLDSILSVATGFALNVVPNTIYLTLFLVPVLAGGVLRKD